MKFEATFFLLSYEMEVPCPASMKWSGYAYPTVTGTGYILYLTQIDHSTHGCHL